MAHSSHFVLLRSHSTRPGHVSVLTTLRPCSHPSLGLSVFFLSFRGLLLGRKILSGTHIFSPARSPDASMVRHIQSGSTGCVVSTLRGETGPGGPGWWVAGPVRYSLQTGLDTVCKGRYRAVASGAAWSRLPRLALVCCTPGSRSSLLHSPSSSPFRREESRPPPSRHRRIDFC